MDFDPLLPSQLQRLGELLAMSGLDPKDFQWGHASGDDMGYESAPALHHLPSGYWFGIGQDYQRYPYSDALTEKGKLVVCRPGADAPFERHRHLIWPDVEARFKTWLGNVTREVGAVDFWEAVERGSFEPRGKTATDNPFTAEERDVLGARLDEINERLGSIESVTNEQREFIAHEFLELKTQLQGLTRWQWWKLFLGTVANVALRHLVPPGAVQYLLQQAKDLFQAVARLALPPG